MLSTITYRNNTDHQTYISKANQVYQPIIYEKYNWNMRIPIPIPKESSTNQDRDNTIDNPNIGKYTDNTSKYGQGPRSIYQPNYIFYIAYTGKHGQQLQALIRLYILKYKYNRILVLIMNYLI
jgi:hypothetical protein